MKRIAALMLVVALMLPVGFASAEAKDFGEQMQEFGEFLGEKATEFGYAAGDALSAFGDQLKAFTEDPDAYIDENEFLSMVRDTAAAAGQSLKEYWPVFKEAVTGSAKTVIDSDMSWNDKKAALKKYAQMAIPYLEEVEFSSKRDEALGAMELSAELVRQTLDAEESWAERQEMLVFYEQQIDSHLAGLIAEANDEELTSALNALKEAVQAAEESQAEDSLSRCEEILRNRK